MRIDFPALSEGQLPSVPSRLTRKVAVSARFEAKTKTAIRRLKPLPEMAERSSVLLPAAIIVHSPQVNVLSCPCNDPHRRDWQFRRPSLVPVVN